MKPLALALLLAASSALAQDAAPTPSPTPAPPTILEWLQHHGSVISGVAVANGERAEFVSVAIDDEFTIQPRLKGFGSVVLFGRQRVAGDSIQTPGIPLSVTDLALYSAGEVTGGAYFEWTPTVGIECRGAMTFAMIGVTGSHGEPVDGTKFLGACGARVTGGVGRLSILAGHNGPVDAGAAFFGFLPSVIFDGEFRLPGNGMTFVLNISGGRDRVTDTAVTSSRFAVRKRF